MPLKICLIGKYFPIQGGVSKDNQWLAYTLAHAGFHVHLITNAEEVEPQYRCHALPWSPFPLVSEACTGSVTVHATSKAERRHYIPYANPFVTKLASLATEVIRIHKCELIYSYYLEPYAMAAYLASRWTGVPYGLRHAGSDVGALFQSPELQPAYREIIQAADYIVATPATYRSFLHLSVPQDKIYLSAGSPLPSDIFIPEAEPLDVNALLAWISKHLPPDPYYTVFRRFAHKPFRQDVATIGMYGKIGSVKGNFDLVEALGRLKSEGLQFQLLMLAQGSTTYLAEFVASLEAQGLTDVTWLLPFLPHWDVPHFLRTCTAICFLERDFPIKIHTPLIPLEVLSCGTCLVLSHEVAEKQSYKERLHHGENVFLVNPQDQGNLVMVLRTVIQDPLNSRRIGHNGFEDIGFERELITTKRNDWPLLFARIYEESQQRRQIMSLAEMQTILAHLYTDDSFRKLFLLAPEASFENYLLSEEEKQVLKNIDQRLLEYFATSLKMKQLEYLRGVYRATFALPQALVQRLFNRFYQFHPAKPHEDTYERIIEFGAYMEQVLAHDEQAPCYASEITRYERLHYQHTYQTTPEDAFAAINMNSPEKLPLHLESVPVLLPGVRRETFIYPVVHLVEALSAHQVPEEFAASSDHYDLVFQREIHSLTLNVFELNAETSLLLDLCQKGEHTTAAIIAIIEQQLGETDMANDVLAMLHVLQEQKILGVRDGR